jgi:predicted O-methyltransferase YrrM
MKCETAYLQNINELTQFIAVLKAENVRSYLEIGSKFGGSLWRIANALPKGSRIIAVDLPHGDQSFKVTLPPLQECIRELINRDYAAELIIGDSTDPAIIKKVREYGPFDACLIDANHTEPYIRKDWANYGQLCRLVAFHDINHTEFIPSHKMPIEVPKVWNEIKTNYRHQEIKLDSGHNGIGVLWRN